MEKKSTTGQDETLTTEQLAEKAIATIEAMSAEEKAKLRQDLEEQHAALNNPTIAYMKKAGLPMLTSVYTALNGADPDDPESAVELLELVEAGILKTTTRGSGRVQ